MKSAEATGSRPELKSRVILVEPRFTGHRLMFVRVLSKAAMAHGINVTLLTSVGCTESEEARAHLDASMTNLEILELPQFSRSIVEDAAKSSGADSIVFLEGDHWMISTLRGKTERHINRTLLILRQRGQSKSKALRAIQTFAKIALRNLVRLSGRARVICILPDSAQRVNKNQVLDPIDFNIDKHTVGAFNAMLSSFSDNPNTRWVGVVGAISKRKNVELLARAIENTKNPDIGLVVAGLSEVPEEILDNWASPLSTSGNPYLRINRILSNNELDALIYSLDVVSVLHDNEGPSAIFSKARAAGSKILAGGSKTLKVAAQRYPSIARWSRLNLKEVTDNLVSILGIPRGKISESSTSDFCEKLLDV